MDRDLLAYNPDDYRLCPVCMVKTGERCYSISGFGDGKSKSVFLREPHTKRTRRKPRQQRGFSSAPLAR